MNKLALLLLTACTTVYETPSTHDLANCPGADAPVDVAADAPADAAPIDWTVPWYSTGFCQFDSAVANGRGADGLNLGDVDGDGLPDFVSGHEEGGGVALSMHPKTSPCGAWTSVRLGRIAGSNPPAYLSGYEDAIVADVDGDGHPDVVGANDGNHRITIWFGPSDPAQVTDEAAWTQVHIVNDSRHWMQLGFADFDHSGHGEIVAGSRVDPSNIGYFTRPSTPRVASAWASSYHQVSAAGWTMSLIPRDVDGDGWVDLVVSDRQAIGSDSSLYGSRWLRNPGGAGAWVNHTIAGRDGTGSAKLIAVADVDADGRVDVVEVRGDNSATNGVPFPNTVRILRNSAADWSGSWTTESLGDQVDVGTVQSAAVGDLDGDGRADIVLGYSYGHDLTQPTGRDATATNLLWLRHGDAGAWTQYPLLGAAGVKVDNTILLSATGDGILDVFQSEQGDAAIPTPASAQLGGFYLRNPRH